MLNARDFNGLYDSLGINTNELGVVMLETESPMLMDLHDRYAEYEYVTDDPAKWWIKGILDSWHVTVKYGLLPMVKQSHAEKVLEVVDYPLYLNTAYYVEDFGTDEYECVVVPINTNGRLSEINAQLRVLPHLDTFVHYNPHITLGYFKKGFLADHYQELCRHIKIEVATKQYSFGRNMRGE